MTPVLDDMVSRPGSTVSLLRTVVGLYLRDAGGWMPTRALLELMAALGVPALLSAGISPPAPPCAIKDAGSGQDDAGGGEAGDRTGDTVVG